MSTTWFMSDLHIGHKLVAAERMSNHPDSVARHDAALAQEWDSRVRKNDVVWVLGDNSVGPGRAERESMAWINQRPGDKYGILGNHCGGHPKHSDAASNMRVYEGVFRRPPQRDGRHTIHGIPVLLSHYPYNGDHTPTDRDTQWRLPDEGVPILHGHTHSQDKVTWSRRGTLQIHVGVDAWGLRPVHVDEIAELLLHHR